jgi:uncharacterized RDD family membrane protein YckC
VNCPSCGQALPPGPQTRCPHCAALVAGPAEGALAPNPQPVTPPARDKQEPLREIPGLRKRERTWKDEVRDRVRHRRQQRGGAEDLPLFRESEEAMAEEPADEPAAEGADVPAEAAPEPVERYVPGPGPRELGEDLREGMDDLPLRRFEAPPAEPEDDRYARSAEPVEDPLRADEEDEEDEDAGAWRLEAPMPLGETRPVERPAQAGERAQAALVDVVLMLGVWAVVLYFASRAARVGLTGLRPAWPYLLTYLAFLGLTYAACFTGVTGQTLGKMLKGLRVVNAAGRPPGCPRAFLRAALGSLGVVLAFGGVVPMFFDPARRGLHDRLLKTRVVKG